MNIFGRRAKRAYKTIGQDVAGLILAAHKEHPEMGRKRLEKLLRNRGVEVDSFELKLFLRENGIGTPPPTPNVPGPPSSFPPIA